MHTSSIRIDATKIFSRRELAAVLNDLQTKASLSANNWLNLILVRLACCCGLRVSEIAGLRISDIRDEPSRPHIRIRRGASKGGRSRTVPLWWDSGTLADLTKWKDERLRLGATPDAPFVASHRLGRPMKTLSRHTLRRRFRTACKVLGHERLETLTIHHERHTFIGHALAGDRKLAEVRSLCLPSPKMYCLRVLRI